MQPVSLFSLLAAAVGQHGAPRQTQFHSIHLPPDIASETVQINYFMTGPFGERGDYVTAERGRVIYEIPASVDGEPAATVKVIAYMPGCEIATLEVSMQGASQARTLLCKALGWTPLRGRISPLSMIQGKRIEVAVNYVALWDHVFFGIMDGLVTSIHVATAVVDENGQFEVEMPDYSKQTNLGRGEFQFTLRQTPGGALALLRPGGTPEDSFGLEVRSSYAPFIVFLADASGFAHTPQ